MIERDFKGVWIPKSLWLDPNLSITEKCLLVEIDSLDSDVERGCFASNEYLAEFLNLSSGRVANMISDLKKRGYVEQVFFDGRNRGLRVTILHENVKNLHENVKADFTKTLKQPSRKREESNIYSNTIERESAHAQSARLDDSCSSDTSCSSDATPDWQDVSKQMYAYAIGDGKEQFRYMCDVARFSGTEQEVRAIFAVWASKASPYQLKNWKREFPRLLSWLRVEAQKKNASGAPPASEPVNAKILWSRKDIPI